MIYEPRLSAVTVITGYYGTGKTNLALNLAFDAARRGLHPTVIDLDIVNPYFRSSDYTEMLARSGVSVVAPVFAGTTLDTPSLSGTIPVRLEAASAEAPVIVDAGGDDAGATALGSYADAVLAKDHALYHVVNARRSLAATPDEVVDIVAQIEAASHIPADGIIGNTHLGGETTWDIVSEGCAFAHKAADAVKLPLMFVTAPQTLFGAASDELPSALGAENVYPVSVYVRTPWEM